MKITITVYEVLNPRNVPFVKGIAFGVGSMKLSWELHVNTARRLPKFNVGGYFQDHQSGSFFLLFMFSS